MKLTYNAVAISTILAMTVIGCGSDDPKNGEAVISWPADAGSVVNGNIPDVPSLSVNSVLTKADSYSQLGRDIAVEYISDNSIQIKISSDHFNLSSITGNIVSGSVSVPGVIPGERNLSIVVDRTNDYVSLNRSIEFIDVKVPSQYAGKKISFVGKGENSNLSYELKGVLDGVTGKLYLVIDDFDYKADSGLEGYWKLNGFKWNSTANTADESPLYVEWETDYEAPDVKGKISPADILQIIVSTPFLPANSFGLHNYDTSLISFNDFFNTVAPVINFSDVQVSLFNVYPWAGSDFSEYNDLNPIFPSQTITYLPYDNGKLKLFINPGAVFNLQVAESRSPGFSTDYFPMNTVNLFGLLSNTLLSLSPGTSDGLSTEMRVSGDTMSWFLTDSGVCTELLRHTLLPLLQNEVYRMRLIRAVEHDSQYSTLSECVESAVNSFNKMLDSTVTLRIGVNTSSYQPEERPSGPIS